MNGGSLRQSIAEVVTEVASLDQAGNTLVRNRSECRFGYRSSLFQTEDEWVVSARLKMVSALGSATVRRRMLAILGDRRRKFPTRMPSCGSTFISDPAVYAELGPPGAIVERFGFKGRCLGQAQVSPLHANFIVNRGGATAADVLALIAVIQRTVQAQTGHLLRAEARYVHPLGEVVPADRAAALYGR